MVSRTENPMDLTTDELDDRYRSTWKSAVGNFSTPAEASLLSIEMNRRVVKESSKENQRLASENHILSKENHILSKENHKLSEENHKLSKYILGISLLALLIAVVSAIFSYIDWKEDNDWQTQQIGELSKISEYLKTTNQLLQPKLELPVATEGKPPSKPMQPTAKAAPG